MQNTSSLLTESGAAALLGITGRQLTRMVREGQVPTVRLPGGIVRFDADQLRAWWRGLRAGSPNLVPHTRPAGELQCR